MFQLNCLGSIYATKAVVEKMKSQGFGHIVFVASEAAFVGIFGLSVYSASKFALRGFAEALNMEVGMKIFFYFLFTSQLRIYKIFNFELLNLFFEM